MTNSKINLRHEVVTDFTTRFYHKEHVIVVDNFFTNVAHFWNLKQCGIYTIRTISSNHNELPFL